MIQKKEFKLFVLFLMFLAGCNYGSLNQSDNNSSEVKVIIDYNNLKPVKEIDVEWKEGFTALRALQHAARVASYPVGEYVFVTEIDSVHGERGVVGWYYTVNGEPTGLIAINNVVNPGDEIRWIFKEDVCSPK